MRLNTTRFATVAGLALLALQSGAQGGSGLAAEGRKIASAIGPAVITVRLIKKSTASFEGQSSTRESKSEVPGMVIDPNGLTVTSLTAADPSTMFSNPAGEGMSSRSEITGAQFVMSDGEEIQAKVVLRDKDFDLMFLRPVTKPKAPMAAIKLQDSAQTKMLDPVILFTRLGKVVNRALGAKVIYVQAVVDKPRRRYILDNDVLSDVGSPVMSPDGKIVGMLAVKVARMATDAADNPRAGSEGFAAVVVTAADLLKEAVQAPEEEVKGPKRSSTGGTTPNRGGTKPRKSR